MEDIYLFITIMVISFGAIYTVNRIGPVQRQKTKDNHYSQLIKIKDDTIEAAGRELRRMRSKLYRLEQGPSYNGETPEKDGEGLDDLVDLYDIAPAWIKKFFSKEDARKFLSDNPDKIKKGLGFLKQKTDKGDAPSDTVTEGV